jgi:PAS domain S-box-containing protein
MIETVNDWIWETDENARFIFSNAQVKNVLGYEPSEILGKTRFDLMPREEAERLAANYVQIVAKKD